MEFGSEEEQKYLEYLVGKFGKNKKEDC